MICRNYDDPCEGNVSILTQGIRKMKTFTMYIKISQKKAVSNVEITVTK